MKSTTSLKTQLATVESERNGLITDLDTLRGRYEANAKSLKAKATHITKLEAVGAAANVSQSTDNQALLQAESTRRAAAEEEVEKLHSAEAALRSEIARLTSEAVVLPEVRRSLQLAEAAAESDATAKRELSGKLTKLEEDFANSSASVVKLRARVEEELANNVDLIQDLTEKDDKISSLTASLEESDERNDELANEITIQATRLSVQAAELVKLSTGQSRQSGAGESQDEDVLELHEQLQELVEQLEEERTKHAQADKTQLLIEAELEHTKKKVTSEEQRYSQLRAKHDEVYKLYTDQSESIAGVLNAPCSVLRAVPCRGARAHFTDDVKCLALTRTFARILSWQNTSESPVAPKQSWWSWLVSAINTR